MRARGYGTYRGRSRWRTVFKTMIVILIVLAALFAGLVVYLEQYLVVFEDGVYLDLPFLQQKEEEVSEPPEETAPSVSDPLPEETEPLLIVEPTPSPVPEILVPVLLPVEAMSDGTAESLVAAVGGNAALFDMKADSGMLGYVSQVEQAVSAGVSPDSPGLNLLISTFTEETGVYTIARVSCFKDHEITNANQNLSIRTNSNYRWTDPDGLRWASPTNADMRDYLTALCVELAQLGFDEIMLDNAGYPNMGNLHYIKKGSAYNAEEFSTIIGGFYQQVAQALEPYDVRLSVVATADALAGEDALTGQTQENLRAWTHHQWLTSDGGYTMAPSA